MADAPPSPIDEELDATIRLVEELQANLVDTSVPTGSQVLYNTKRLVAGVRRLRRLVRGADKLLRPGSGSSLTPNEAAAIYDAIRQEVKRA